MRRHPGSTLLWIGLFAAVAGCTDTADRDLDSVVTVLSNAEERVLGPTWDDSPKFLMFLPLVNYEGGSYCGDPTPALAERWEHSPDYRTWTVWIRDNVRWHDGFPVTAGDLKFTVDLLKHPDVLNYNAFGVDSVVVVNERAARIFLTRPGRWPMEGWATVFPRHLLEKLAPGEFYDWEFWKQPVGNGPFRYVRHVPQTMMELEANPDYYRGKPSIERVILRFVPEGGPSALLEMRRGNADLTTGLGLLQANQLAEDPRFQVHNRVSTSHGRWLVYNPQDSLFQDVRVRRALTQAVDRHALHADLGFPAGLPLADAPYTVCRFVSGEFSEAKPTDPVAAGRLLEAAGWRDQNGDGFRERDGEELRFITLVAAGEQRVALLLQNEFRQAGVRMEIQRLDGTLVMDRIRDGDFQAVIPPIWALQPILTPSINAKDRSYDGFRETYPSVVGLLDQALKEPESAEQERLYRELAREFRRESPALFLYPMVNPIVADRRIRGFDHGGWMPPAWRWAFGGLEWLWIEEDG